MFVLCIHSWNLICLWFWIVLSKKSAKGRSIYTQNIMICSSFTGSENTLLTSFMHCKVCVEEHFFTCNSESRFGMNNIMIMHALVNSNIRNLVATIIIEHKSYISQIQIQTVDLNYMKKIGQRRHFWNSLKTSK